MQELGPAYVRTVKEAVGTAVERQRRRRLPGPLLVPGLCLPKALAPLVPIYLQGVLQVRRRSNQHDATAIRHLKFCSCEA